MSTKHTPGPWTAETWEDQEFGDFGWSFSHENHRVPLSTFEGDKEEAEANARLIAAAPELLEALQDVLAWGTDESYARAHAACEKARAVIAKAIGEQP